MLEGWTSRSAATRRQVGEAEGGGGSMEKNFVEGVKKLIGSRPRQFESTEFSV
jgi:hypothetical protein